MVVRAILFLKVVSFACARTGTAETCANFVCATIDLFPKQNSFFPFFLVFFFFLEADPLQKIPTEIVLN